MKTIAASEKVLRVLEDFTPGASLEAKLEYLTRESLQRRLQACNEALSRFEAKYGLTFTDFARSWREDKIPAKHTHTVERDFMEWEACHLEKEEVLTAARELGLPEPEP